MLMHTLQRTVNLGVKWIGFAYIVQASACINYYSFACILLLDLSGFIGMLGIIAIPEMKVTVGLSCFHQTLSSLLSFSFLPYNIEDTTASIFPPPDPLHYAT